MNPIPTSPLPPPPQGRTVWPWRSAATPYTAGAVSTLPRISIVTPSYNQGHYLEETLRSVLLQEYPNLEYIVIDGGSTDASPDIINRYRPWLHFAVSEPDRGQSHALNKGFEQSSGEIYGWLCSDDILLPGALMQVALRMDLTHPCWLVGGAYTIDERSGRQLFHRVPESFGIANFVLWQTRCVPQPSIFWNKHLQDSVGGLDESLHYCMDPDLWFRFFRVTAPAFIDRGLSRYRIHERAKTALDSPQYQKSQLEFSTWLLRMLEQEARRPFRNDLIEALVEMQRQTIAWRRIREHAVLGGMLRLWRKMINPDLPIG